MRSTRLTNGYASSQKSRLTATLPTQALTPAQLPDEAGGLLVAGGVVVVVFEVVVVVWLVVGEEVGALAPPCKAPFTAASKRPFATQGRQNRLSTTRKKMVDITYHRLD